MGTRAVDASGTPTFNGEVTTHTAQDQVMNGFLAFHVNMRFNDEGLLNQLSWVARGMSIDMYGLIDWNKLLAIGGAIIYTVGRRGGV